MFHKLIPILYVRDLQAERDWYLRLGFQVSYEGPEYPNFVALESGEISFGIEERDDFDSAAPDRVLVWQIGVSSIDDSAELLASAGIDFDEEWFTPRPDWKYRVLHTRSPNGYHVMLEGNNEATG